MKPNHSSLALHLQKCVQCLAHNRHSVFFFFLVKEGREGSRDVEGEVARSRDVEGDNKKVIMSTVSFSQC